MKRCKSCQQTKFLDQFYEHQCMGDGYLNYCIECVKARVTAHRAVNAEKIRAYDRERGRTKERLELNRERSRANRKKYASNGKRWGLRNREKTRAHVKLRRAIAAGKITKMPCEVCGNPKSEGHHDDYTKPLEVRWLCRVHHAEHHRRYKESA